MSKSVNCVDLLSFLGGDVEIKHLPDGSAVGNVSVATDCSVWNDSGEWPERME